MPNPYTTGLIFDFDPSIGMFQDATMTTPCAAGGDLIYVAADQSAMPNNLIQATSGARPAWYPNIVNSKPVARFTGAAKYLSAMAFSAQSQSQHIFVVYATNNRVVQDVLVYEGANFQFYQNNGGFIDLYDTVAHQTANGSITAARDFQLLELICNGTAGSVNQNQWFSAPLSGSLANNSLSALTIGATAAGGLPLNGDIARILIYNAPVTGASLIAVQNYLLGLYGIPIVYSSGIPFVLYEGDSQTNGQGTTLNSQEYPEVALQAITSAIGTYNHVNLAVSGSQFTDLTNRAAVRDTYYNALRGTGKNILNIFCGTNDIVLGGQTGHATYTRAKNYALAAKTVGWKTRAYTMLPRGSVAQVETYRQDYNGDVRGNADGAFDVIVDIGADPLIGIPGAALNTTYFNADQIHLNPTGQQILALYETGGSVKAFATNSTIVTGSLGRWSQMGL